MNNLEETYPAYDNWLSKNMVELKKAVAHLPMEETSDIIEVAGRLIWLAAQQQDGYVMVPVEPTERMLDCAYSSISDNLHYADLENIYRAMTQGAQE